MKIIQRFRVLFLCPSLLVLTAAAASNYAAPPSYKPSEAELQPVRAQAADLATAIKDLRARKVSDTLLTDVEVYLKAAEWILRFSGEEFFQKRYVADTAAALQTGLARAKELADGKSSWTTQKGRLVRAYRSRVDGSVQPFGLIIPETYNPARGARLDVVLHGRGATLNEVSFIASHDRKNTPIPAEQNHLVLEVFGRGNNAYRWAGETDVFEAIQTVRKSYAVDEKQIVLRGFSMGGAGAWHLGLHHTDKWAAVEAGAGFTETKRYAKLDNLPPWQDSALHIYDAADYAVNAFNVPMVSYAGDKDPQLQAANNIREMLQQEGFKFASEGLNWLGQDLRMIFLVGPNTGHKWEPETKKLSDKFINESITKPGTTTDTIRFATYTLRYNRCSWLRVDKLDRHYERAEVTANWDHKSNSLSIKTKNVAALSILSATAPGSLSIDGRAVSPAKPQAQTCRYDRMPAGWTPRSPSASQALCKISGLQGPIDDAFMDSFLCVRPTGNSPHPISDAGAQSALDRITKEFPKWMRGDVQIKDDRNLSGEDIANNNLILFGDPASNAVLARIAGKLPIVWGKENITVRNQSYSAKDHMLVMIYPNPLNPHRYVVINSGHTFGEKEFRGTNALLFPRLGDYAVLRITRSASGVLEQTVETAGFFGEQWELPTAK